MIAVASHLRSSPRARLIGLKLLAIAMLAVAVGEASLAAKLDLTVNRHLHDVTASWLTGWIAALTHLAGTTWVLWLTAVAAVVLMALRHWRGAAALLLSVFATQATVTLLKLVVARPRPEEQLSGVQPEGFSFPSAHSATAVALYVMLAVIAGTMARGRLRVAAYVAAAGVVVLVGISRIYLGAHYPSDVLAGWLTGGVLVMASWAVCSRLPAGPASARTA